MSLWIPDDRLWIFSVVEEFQKKAEAEGIPLSQGDIILAILEESWAELRKKFHRSKIKIKKKKKGKSLRRMVVCRQRDSWLFDYLDKIVETKKDVGIRTSFSYELLGMG